MGARGQFDVVADGETIAGRAPGLMKRLLGGGWPDEGEVVEALRARLPA
ncbi:MAG: hypothetical protein KF878_14390 [Planctomycetes bacterium]|nr:hypothetical protein [Planctomycetota bacterium]